MRNIFKYAIVFIIGGALSSCLDDGGVEQGTQFDFAYLDILDSDTSGWIGGFADFPDSLKDDLNFKVEYTELSNVFEQDNNVLRISAENPHKDLFYFVTKKFKGLEPNKAYKIGATFEMQAKLLTDTTGTFTPELYFKMGLSNVMPDTVVDIDAGGSYYVLNLSKGNNETAGSDFVFLGKPDPNLKIGKDTPRFIRNSDITATKTAQTNSSGELWLTIGVDSKMPFEMSFAYNTIMVYFKEM